MKRWNFGGLRATHGVSLPRTVFARFPTGSDQNPGRVFKNKKNGRHPVPTVSPPQNLTVVRTRCLSRGLMPREGAVSGHDGSFGKIRDGRVKESPAADAPKAGSFKVGSRSSPDRGC